ncbi:MAG: hypothetical protein WC822_01380 [Candidatus Paceibacterota bacterium]|jgi:hypothetical protein
MKTITIQTDDRIAAILHDLQVVESNLALTVRSMMVALLVASATKRSDAGIADVSAQFILDAIKKGGATTAQAIAAVFSLVAVLLHDMEGTTPDVEVMRKLESKLSPLPPPSTN